MTGGNPAEGLSPGRRALLKAAVAGGVFAVPLIASFSMDTASAHTRAGGFGSSNQAVFLSCGNMTSSNMTTVPTAVFYAELRQVSSGPVVGLAGLEFVSGRDNLYYELIVGGTLSSFTVSAPSGYGFTDQTSSKVGTIPGTELDCSPSGVDPLADAYTNLAAGGSTIQVFLANGTVVYGTIVELGFGSPAWNSFHFSQS